VVNETETGGTGEEETALPVVPSKTSDEGGKTEAHEDDQVEVPLVLPLDDRVSREIRNVGGSDLSSRLDEHPSNVRVPEAYERRTLNQQEVEREKAAGGKAYPCGRCRGRGRYRCIDGELGVLATTT
jgi:hypothetical protein